MHIFTVALSLFFLTSRALAQGGQGGDGNPDYNNVNVIMTHDFGTSDRNTLNIISCRALSPLTCCMIPQPGKRKSKRHEKKWVLNGQHFLDNYFNRLQVRGLGGGYTFATFFPSGRDPKQACTGMAHTLAEVRDGDNGLDISGAYFRGVMYTSCVYNNREAFEVAANESKKAEFLIGAFQVNSTGTECAPLPPANLTGLLTDFGSPPPDSRSAAVYKRAENFPPVLGGNRYPDLLVVDGVEYTDDYRGDLRYRDRDGNLLDLESFW